MGELTSDALTSLVFQLQKAVTARGLGAHLLIGDCAINAVKGADAVKAYLKNCRKTLTHYENIANGLRGRHPELLSAFRNLARNRPTAERCAAVCLARTASQCRVDLR